MSDIEKDWNLFLNRIGLYFVEALKDRLTKGDATDTNFLKANINYEIDGDDILINMPEYAKYLEYGTAGRLKAPKGQSPNPSRKMPVEKQGDTWKHYIEDWAKRKMGVVDDNELWAISKHIQLYGTKPYPFIRLTWKKDLKRLVNKAFNRTFR